MQYRTADNRHADHALALPQPGETAEFRTKRTDPQARLFPGSVRSTQRKGYEAFDDK